MTTTTMDMNAKSPSTTNLSSQDAKQMKWLKIKLLKFWLKVCDEALVYARTLDDQAEVNEMTAERNATLKKLEAIE